MTQPILPVLREEFGVDARAASRTVSAVILGIALATLPFGRMSDRRPVRPILLAGGTVVAASGLLCAGFFTVHAAAAGSLNRRLSAGRGRANSLSVLCYYLGGTAGITASGHAFNAGGWRAVVGLGVAVIAAVFAAVIAEARASRRSGAGGEEDPGAGG